MSVFWVRLRRRITFISCWSKEDKYFAPSPSVSLTEQLLAFFLLSARRFVDSGSLAGVIQKYGVFQEKLIAVYLKQVLEGLCYLHENGVVHRDIKSHNLLITSSGVVKLADFGIAHLYQPEGALALMDTDVGSPYWMAPEVIQLIEASPASDIWSLGCTALELLTGSPPWFEMSKTQACFRMVEEDHPPIPETMSLEMRAFVLRCFKKDPKARATAPRLLEDPWMLGQAKKAPMKRHTSITNLPRFQVTKDDKQSRKKKEAVQKSISSTTLPRFITKDDGRVEQVAGNKSATLSGKGKEGRGSIHDAFEGLPPRPSETCVCHGIVSCPDKRPPGGDVDAIATVLLGDAQPQPLPEKGKSGGSKSGCMACGTKLGFMGKHPCDGCDRNFCKNCIQKKVLPRLAKGSSKVCPECAVRLEGEQPDNPLATVFGKTVATENRTRAGSVHLPAQSTSGPPTAATVTGTPTLLSPRGSALLSGNNVGGGGASGATPGSPHPVRTPSASGSWRSSVRK